jgi:hypothetical protein
MDTPKTTAIENKRIATLTTGAITTTTESAVAAMLAAVEAAEAKTAEMRAAVEAFIKEFEEATNSLADNVTTHIASCQAAIDSFQHHHLKILNIPEQAVSTPEPTQEPAEPPTRTVPRAVNFDEELGKLRAIVPSAVDGRH